MPRMPGTEDDKPPPFSGNRQEALSVLNREQTADEYRVWLETQQRVVSADEVLSYVDFFAGQENDDAETGCFIISAAKMVAEGKTRHDFGMVGFAHFVEWLGEQPEVLFGPEIQADELKDDICDAITDSLDMDWTGDDGAKAVVTMFEHRGWAVIKARPEP